VFPGHIFRFVIPAVFYTEEFVMKLKKQMILPVLLSLSVFFSSSVVMSASAYASVTPRAAVVRELAEAAPGNTVIPDTGAGNTADSGKSPAVKPRKESSFFGELIEKIAVMFLLYMFLEAIQAIMNDFFNEGNTKIKITPKEKQNPSNQKQNNTKRLPAEEV